MLPSRDFWRSVCGWEKSWRKYPPQAFVIFGEYRKEPPWEKAWSEKRIRLCDALRWGKWGQGSLVWLNINQASHLQGPWWWTGLGWSCPLIKCTTTPLWGDHHVDKGSRQPTESSCNGGVAVLQLCHQASDHFPPSPQFQEGDTLESTFGFLPSSKC